MKGRPAEEIFKELGLEPKWPGLTNDEKRGNERLPDVYDCFALDQNEDEYSLQLGDTMVPLLANHSFCFFESRGHIAISASHTKFQFVVRVKRS